MSTVLLIVLVGLGWGLLICALLGAFLLGIGVGHERGVKTANTCARCGRSDEPTRPASQGATERVCGSCYVAVATGDGDAA